MARRRRRSRRSGSNAWIMYGVIAFLVWKSGMLGGLTAAQQAEQAPVTGGWNP